MIKAHITLYLLLLYTGPPSKGGQGGTCIVSLCMFLMISRCHRPPLPSTPASEPASALTRTDRRLLAHPNILVPSLKSPLWKHSGGTPAITTQMLLLLLGISVHSFTFWLLSLPQLFRPVIICYCCPKTPVCFVCFYSVFLCTGVFVSCSVFDRSGSLYIMAISIWVFGVKPILN